MGEWTHPDRHTPVLVTGDPSTSAPPIPPATSPPDTPLCRPISAAVTKQRKATIADPATGEEDPQGPPLTTKKTHRGAHLRCRRRPAGGTPGSLLARPPATAAAPPPPPAAATVGADARSPRCPWPAPPGPRSGRPSPPTAATAPSRHRRLLPPCCHSHCSSCPSTPSCSARSHEPVDTCSASSRAL